MRTFDMMPLTNVKVSSSGSMQVLRRPAVACRRANACCGRELLVMDASPNSAFLEEAAVPKIDSYCHLSDDCLYPSCADSADPRPLIQPPGPTLLLRFPGGAAGLGLRARSDTICQHTFRLG